MVRKYEISIKDHIINFAISLIITIVLNSIMGSMIPPPFSGEWLVFELFFLYVIFVTIDICYRAVFIPSRPKPVVPKPVSAFDKAVREATYNFCAISSKEIALWKSPTFSYYLILNDIKNIIEYHLQTRSIQFSTQPEDKKSFYAEGLEIIKKISNAQVPPMFFGIRLLIYPQEVYEAFKDEILSLIQMHAVARVHCIPVIREEIIQKLNEKEKTSLQALVTSLGQKVNEEYTALSGWDKLILRFRKSPQNPYSISIPDFLIINYNPRGKEKKQVWWYKGEMPMENDEDTVVDLAEKCYKILCNKINGCIWAQYTSDALTCIPVGTVSLGVGDFFSQDYFRKWITDVVPQYNLLKEWVNAENDTLAEIIKKNKINEALDIGCGWGRHIEIMMQLGVPKAAGVDNNFEMVKKFGELYTKYGDRVCVRLENAQKITFEDNRFDLVICMTNTFGNIGDASIKKEVVNEIYRVLKPKGILILSVYNHSSETLEIRKQSYIKVGLHPFILDDERTIRTKEGLISEQFTPKDIRSYLTKGFENISIKYINKIGFIMIAQKSQP